MEGYEMVGEWKVEDGKNFNLSHFCLVESGKMEI